MKHTIELTAVEIEQAIRDFAALKHGDVKIKNATGEWKIELLHGCPDGSQSTQHSLGVKLHKEED